MTLYRQLVAPFGMTVIVITLLIKKYFVNRNMLFGVELTNTMGTLFGYSSLNHHFSRLARHRRRRVSQRAPGLGIGWAPPNLRP